MTLRPNCFVIMPFGRKKDPSRKDAEIDFDRLYSLAIKPAIEEAGLEPTRADEEKVLGTIHKPMFERLLLSDFAVAEVTVPNPNVFYELGVRHALNSDSTLPIFARHTSPPFDIALLRALPYELSQNGMTDDEIARLRESLKARLVGLRELARRGSANSSPIFELLKGAQGAMLGGDQRLRRVQEGDRALFELLQRYGGHEKTDIFRDLVDYNEQKKEALRIARVKKDLDAIVAIRDELGELEQVHSALIIDLLLSFRALGAYDRMCSLFDQMPVVLQRSVLVREQLAFALNRMAAKAEEPEVLRGRAEGILREVLQDAGPNSETLGLLGRISKDRWQAALSAGDDMEAAEYLSQAIDSYRAGFEADCRDAYPGINAATLLEVEGSDESLEAKAKLLPAVSYAASLRAESADGDYWDWATLVEAAVLMREERRAMQVVGKALARVRESWEPETTARNLAFIAETWAKRGQTLPWLAKVIDGLNKKATDMRERK